MAVFDYVVARSIQEGLDLIADSSVATLPIGGGTDLLPLLKDGVIAAERLVAIDAIPGMDAITQADDGLSIGAAATIADVAAHPAIGRDYPVLAQAAIGLATPQIRTVGTIGGNLNQRPRCWYFRSPLIPCLKKGRRPVLRSGRDHQVPLRHRRGPLLYRASLRYRSGPFGVGRQRRDREYGRSTHTGHRRLLLRARPGPDARERAGAWRNRHQGTVAREPARPEPLPQGTGTGIGRFCFGQRGGGAVAGRLTKRTGGP